MSGTTTQQEREQLVEGVRHHLFAIEPGVFGHGLNVTRIG